MWTWTALDADSKLIVSYLVGGRDSEYAIEFMDDVAKRLAKSPFQMTTDGHKAYLEAVEGAFGGDIDYAQLVKMYGAAPESMKGRYSPAECTGIRKRRVEGDPAVEDVSMSYVECQNLTMAYVNASVYEIDERLFKEDRQPHFICCRSTLCITIFAHIHKSLKVTPAMAAGVSDTLHDMDWIVELIDARAPKTGAAWTAQER